ncbi:xylulose-5-phosphate/fructose-6-phosphate phosphoketolase [Virgibacillus halotolerans]|uniref:phosphoketolase family protein n=1 Tax=Virgibacillus halotolerans TaxID=1071053 RepID=UPI001EF79561|nr:phosphoketolase family protein [Virgibacillus halotolerans]MBM7599109.1 xylulose-5-phosphate/fructose-6-phosphate phosphoketolase [Virgibacillus halotolerans]
MTIDFNSEEYLKKVDGWWRAANYISVGQTFMKNNPLLRRDIVAEDIKRKPIGHWGTIPAGNFVYAHLNRLINKHDLNMFYIVGSGHGGPVMNTFSYLDGSYTELYPDITQDEEGMKKFFQQFSFPGGIGSHAAPETPGSIHEGGELGYSLAHATGAILDNPNLIAVPFIGDGETETGPLAAGWFANVFINPVNDGAVLPIINLNGAKISNPTILARKSDEDLTNYFKGMGWDPIFIEGEEPMEMHRFAAEKFDYAIKKIKSIQEKARQKSAKEAKLEKWPVILLRTLKGWTGPKEYDGKKIEGSFRSHQIPIPVTQYNMKDVKVLEKWLKSYRPEELFTEEGKLVDELQEIAPKHDKLMSLNPVTNGGKDVPSIKIPSWKNYTLDIEKPGLINAQDMIEFGKFTRDIIKENLDTFRVFGPDETASNRLQKIFEATDRQWLEPVDSNTDEFVSPVGRVIDSQLSEHQAQGFLEGYVLTGRYGFYASYESFFRITDSMLTQHFKWIKKTDDFKWRKPVQSLNLIASSTVFQQDHNGYTHQDPGLITHLAEKSPEYIRAYLPADTNTLLAVMDKMFKSEHLINLAVASKQVRPQFYSVDEAEELVEKGFKIIDWASTVKNDEEPDVVIAASGTEPNLEALATISILNKTFPGLKIRFVNVVDLFKLRHPKVDPRGITDKEFDSIFTTDKPIIFAFHAYEGLIRDIFYRRSNRNLYIHGYREEGGITTPFDMRVFSQMDRFHMAKEVAELVYGQKASDFVQKMNRTLCYHHEYIGVNGSDIPEVENWMWAKLNN